MLVFSAGAKYSGGDGSVGSPYKLSSAEDILTLAASDGDWGALFELVCDIDLASAEIKPFTQDLENAFGGQIDGKGFKIKNLRFKGVIGRYVGLFGLLSRTAVIRNLSLVGVDIDVATPVEEEKNNYLYVGGLAGSSKAFIENCRVSGVIKARAKQLVSVGALTGRQEREPIDRCEARVEIEAISPQQSFAGGLIGYCTGADIFNSLSDSRIYAGDSERSYAGGICGYSLYSKYDSCESSGGKVVTDSGSYSGGIGGYCYDGTITNCIGSNDVFSFDNGFAGGITGGNYNSIIENCYFNGRLSSRQMGSRSGTIAGLNAKSQIINCFWVYDKSLSQKAIAEGIFIGDVFMLTESQIKSGLNFDEKKWNAGSGRKLWQFTEGKLPQLSRAASIAEDE